MNHLERIRNTLSHEMCHLACWVIDNHPLEGHGQLFKSWLVSCRFYYLIYDRKIYYQGEQSDVQASEYPYFCKKFTLGSETPGLIMVDPA